MPPTTPAPAAPSLPAPPKGLQSTNSVNRLSGQQESLEVATATSLTSSASDDREHAALLHFVALSQLFHTWRDRMTAASAQDKAGIGRFLWFCSDISNFINEHLRSSRVAPADSCDLSAECDKLSLRLASEVNAVVLRLCPVAKALPKVTLDSMDVDVERQVYKQLPFGVIMLPVQHRLFNTTGPRPWVNPRAAQLLGYSPQELKGIVSQRLSMLQLLLHPADMMCWFWDAVLREQSQFTRPTQWRHRLGTTVPSITAYRIKYVDGLPVWLCLYIQHQDSQATEHPTQERSVAAAAAVPDRAATSSSPSSSGQASLPFDHIGSEERTLTPDDDDDGVYWSRLHSCGASGSQSSESLDEFLAANCSSMDMSLSNSMVDTEHDLLSDYHWWD